MQSMTYQHGYNDANIQTTLNNAYPLSMALALRDDPGDGFAEYWAGYAEAIIDQAAAWAAARAPELAAELAAAREAIIDQEAAEASK